MKKKFLKLLMVLAVTMNIYGCKPVRTKVAYTVYPIRFLIDYLSGSQIDALPVQDENCIVQRAVLSEDAEEILSNSIVFFHIGTLEPYLTVNQNLIVNSGAQMYDLSTLNAVYRFQRYTQVVTDGDVTYIESPYYRSDAFRQVDTDTLDLYLWNDPISMLSIAKDIKDWLVKTYPEDEALFTENLRRLETDLINIDAAYQALATSLINNKQEIRFVSMTASFGNWQKTYGFQVYPVILSKYGAFPTPSQLEAIKARILTDNVRYIVYEPNMTDDMKVLFEQLETELGLTRVELSNLSSLTDTEELEGKDYLSVMWENLSVLETMKTDISGGE